MFIIILLFAACGLMAGRQFLKKRSERNAPPLHEPRPIDAVVNQPKLVSEEDPPKLRVFIRAGHEDCVVDADPFTIGRKSDNLLVLDYEHVSRRHAELRREEGHWYLFDSGSANGVFVNGRRISGTPLEHEDKIDIGPFHLQFVHPGIVLPKVFTIADLSLGEEIGRGGMARVYLARVLSTGDQVAVKMPSFAGSSDPEQLRKRFLREVTFSERLRHPNIVRVLGHGSMSNDHPYMVMEYLPGGPMRAIMEAGQPMDEKRVRSIGADLAAGLSSAHMQKIVHRDIKPENVLFGADGRGKLTDFGIARGGGLPSLTLSGMAIGTCHYMSPEQAQVATITPASDLYSLGCTLFEMSVGRCPFEGVGLSILRSHIHEPPPRARSIQGEISLEMDQLLARMLEKDPARRPDAMEVKSILRGA